MKPFFHHQAYSFVPGLNIPEAVVRGQVMPGLTSLLEAVQEVAPEMETAVLQVMSEMIMMMILILIMS